APTQRQSHSPRNTATTPFSDGAVTKVARTALCLALHGFDARTTYLHHSPHDVDKTRSRQGKPMSTSLDQQPEQTPEAAEPAAGHRHLGIALAVITIAQLMVVLDATIANIAI